MARSGDHAAVRRAFERAGVIGRPCARCGFPILPGDRWDLDHLEEAYVDGGRGRREPSHAYCNRSHGARLGNARRRSQPMRRPIVNITTWPALGIDMTPDRTKTWVARAARDARDCVVIELLDPLPVAPAERVAETLNERCGLWDVLDVAIDPRSPAATLLDPVRRAGVPVKEADTHGVAVAHGQFQDLLNEGRLRVRGHSALDDAARLAAERKLAGAHAVDRYAADLAPLVAAELAAWALLEEPQPFFAAWR